MACWWTYRRMSCYLRQWGKWVSKIHEWMDVSMHGHGLAWGWVRWQCCSMPVLCQTIWLQCQTVSVQFLSYFFPVLQHVFRKEYGLVSCKPLFWYTTKGEAVMMVPWPWIKASHPVRGHGCFQLGPRGGHPLERAYINLIPCYSRLWSPRLKSFSWTMSRVIPSIER